MACDNAGVGCLPVGAQAHGADDAAPPDPGVMLAAATTRAGRQSAERDVCRLLIRSYAWRTSAA
ncbi:hypothetical protein tb265_42250 [Gemmatimonadetes bacterium T265]|nr:hypothetical protein tb265_42250 [Gemmatimonadetes bacterium T265]